MRRLRNCELGLPSARSRDRSEDCSALLVARIKTDLIMHRATEESGLTDSADGSIARRAEAVGLDRDEAATSALTNSAFSWKFDLDGLLRPQR
jgi:hypothetical protein